MGQYYKPASLDKKEYLESWSIHQGAKLMEHSYIGNELMNQVENLIIPGGAWYKNKLIWAGDYADQEPGYKKTKEGYDVNIYTIMSDEGKQIHPRTTEVDKKYHYLLNHTNRLAIDLNKIKPDRYEFKIHPLPLLICEGNGRGGGDFHGNDTRIGTWARQKISLEEKIPKGYLEVIGQFYEER